MSTKIDKVGIREETEGKETGGHFAVATISFSAPASQVTTKDYTPKIPISLLSATLPLKGLNDGDTVRLDISPDTVVGALDQAVASSVSLIPVPQSIIDLFLAGSMFVGQKMFLKDGTNTDDLGLILSYDDTGNTVTVQTPTTNAFVSSDSILVTTCMTPAIIDQDHVEIVCSENEYHFGEDKIGSRRVESGQKIRIIYDNKNASIAVNVVTKFSFLY